jgi:hypothetical protein
MGNTSTLNQEACLKGQSYIILLKQMFANNPPSQTHQKWYVVLHQLSDL